MNIIPKIKRWIRRWKDVRQELCSGTGEKGLQYLLQYSSLPPQSSQSASDTGDHILSCWALTNFLYLSRVWVLALDFGLCCSVSHSATATVSPETSEVTFTLRVDATSFTSESQKTCCFSPEVCLPSELASTSCPGSSDLCRLWPQLAIHHLSNTCSASLPVLPPILLQYMNILSNITQHYKSLLSYITTQPCNANTCLTPPPSRLVCYL